MEQACAPSGDLKHNRPARCCDGFLSLDGNLDLVEFLVDPVFVTAVVVQLVQNSQCFVTIVGLDEVLGQH